MSVITVTPTVDTVNVPARVRLDVADTGSPAFTSTTITRLNPDGTTVAVRTTDGNPQPISGTTTLYDYEMPYGQAVTYSSLETPANVTVPVTVSVPKVWLVHPGVPARSMPITLGKGTFTSRKMAAPRGVFYPMGRSTPIVVTSGARTSVQTNLVVVTRANTEADQLRALTADAGVLLLNVDATLGYNLSTCYVSVGDIDDTTVVDNVFETWRTFTLPLVVVSRPAGGTQSQRTLADLLVYPTLTGIQAQYPTLAAVLAGP